MKMSCRVSFSFWLVLNLLAFAACDDPFEHSKCKNVIVAEHVSPDKAFSAVIYEGFCKPDTKRIVETQVDIDESGEWPRSGTMVFHAVGKQPVKTIWVEPRHLQIECQGIKPDQILKQESQWRGVKISYKF
jgi:hypothetical protein